MALTRPATSRTAAAAGAFEGISGRVAQLNGGGADAGNGTFDISYDLVFETQG